MKMICCYKNLDTCTRRLLNNVDVKAIMEPSWIRQLPSKKRTSRKSLKIQAQPRASLASKKPAITIPTLTRREMISRHRLGPTLSTAIRWVASPASKVASTSLSSRSIRPAPLSCHSRLRLLAKSIGIAHRRTKS